MCLGKIGVITKVWQDGGVPVGLVDTGSTAETVCLLACPTARAGANVLVHLGFAVEVLDRRSAEEAARLRAGAGSEEASRERGEPPSQEEPS
jgi:hydrogenase expression/formation protein HypC